MGHVCGKGQGASVSKVGARVGARARHVRGQGQVECGGKS